LKTYFLLFLIATIASLVTTPLIRRLCEHFQLLDVPRDSRRLHTRAIPRLGGVALFISCALALSTLPFIDNLLTQNLRAHSADMWVAFVPSTLVLLLGVYDDLRGANAIIKFVGLGLIASLFFALGGHIEALSVPYWGSVQLPIVLSYLITVLWLVGIANAFNLIDGLDGLASGAALFSSLVILAVSIAQDRPIMIVVSLVMCGGLAGFLRYNFNPASIFLGDSGALFIGFTLAALSVLGVQKATTAVAIVVPILAFGFPMVDTAITMGRRLVSKRPMFQGDNEHIHHMLLARGWSQRQVAIVLYGVCASFGLFAVVFNSTSSRVVGFFLFVISVVVMIAVGHLHYHEVDELKAGVRRTVSNRRLRLANNIRVRRAARSLSNATELHDVLEALRLMLEFGEFDFANARIGRIGRSQINQSAYSKTMSQHPNDRIQFRSGVVYWSWADVGINADSVLKGRSSWCFRLPLTKDGIEWGWLNLYRSFQSNALLLDTNYLSDLFRRELTAAIERILLSHETALAEQPIMVSVHVEEIAG
jgi:UDP-GlcNAc:undecaprenyl-phosphate GlcNAc-1-phosphate transferase